MEECIYDQGGYFVINGSEKVLVAQERLNADTVYCFKRRMPYKYTYTCDIRSTVPGNTRPPFAVILGMMVPKSDHGEYIACELPYILKEVPVVLVFRALGLISDREILEHITYDLSDSELMEKFRPSLEVAKHITKQTNALDFIGRRGSAVDAGKEDRVKYARVSVMQRAFLPHMGQDPTDTTKKAFFLGYMVNRL